MGIELFIASALGGGAVATAVAGYIVNFAVSAVIATIFKPKQPGPQPDPGVEQRLAANTRNRIPTFYGNGRARGITTFADITDDNQSMAFLLVLSEGPIQAIGDVYWDGKLIEFDAAGEVTNTVGPDGDEDFLNGNLRIVRAPAGGRSTEMETFSTRWNTNAVNRTMPNVAYVYVELRYNRDKNVTQLTPNLEFDVQGKLVRAIQPDGTLAATRTFSNSPADCMVDYMLDGRHGSGNILAESDVDLNSFLAWKSFCAQQLPHLDAAGATVAAARYTCNGFANAGDSIGTILADFTAGSQAQLNYAQGTFNIIVDTIRTSVMSFDEDNSYGTVNINEEGFSALANKMTVKFNSRTNQFLEEQIFLLTPVGARNPSEPELSRELTMAFIDNNIEAERIGAVLLNQSRNTQTISFVTDMRALEVQAGDLISVSNTSAGLLDKEFVVLSITDAAVSSSTVSGFNITAREYTATAYDDRMITAYDATPNTSFPSPFNIRDVGDLSVGVISANAAVPSFTLTFTIPLGSLVDRVDVYRGVTNIFADAELIDSVSTSERFIPLDIFTYTSTGLPAGTYFYFIRIGNNFATSNTSNTVSIMWAPQVAAGGFTLNPEFTKNAIILSLGSDGNIDLTNGTVSFALLEGGSKVTLNTTATSDAQLANDEWRLSGASVVGGLVVSSSLDAANNEVDLTVTTFTSNGSIALAYRYKDSMGSTSALTAAIDVAEAPRGVEGPPGDPSIIPGPPGGEAPRVVSRTVYQQTVTDTQPTGNIDSIYNFTADSATVISLDPITGWSFTAPIASQGTARYWQGTITYIETVTNNVRTNMSPATDVTNISRGFSFDGIVTFSNTASGNQTISDGVTTFNVGAVQTTATNANTTAVNAASAASTAQTTAVNAASTASTANTTAVNAASAASTAQTTAVNANTTAVNANAAAVTAGTAAATANANALTAQTAANAAQATANGGLPLADLQAQLNTRLGTAGTTVIDGGRITANSISAGTIGAGTLGANVIYAGNINANNINAGTISAARFVGAGIARLGSDSFPGTRTTLIAGTSLQLQVVLTGLQPDTALVIGTIYELASNNSSNNVNIRVTGSSTGLSTDDNTWDGILTQFNSSQNNTAPFDPTQQFTKIGTGVTTGTTATITLTFPATAARGGFVNGEMFVLGVTQ